MRLAAVSVPEALAEKTITKATSLGFRVEELEEEIDTPGGVRLNPRTSAPSQFQYPAAQGLFIVQYTAPPTQEWEYAVRNHGVVIVEQLAHRAVVVTASVKAFEQVRNLPFVQFASSYAPEFKFQPRTPRSALGLYVVQFADTAATKGVIAASRTELGGFLHEVAYNGRLNARVNLSNIGVNTLLQNPAVLGIEEYVPLQPSDERQSLSIKGTSLPSGDYLSYLASRGITPDGLIQSGIVIDVADSGIDNGCPTLDDHADLSGNIMYFQGVSPYNLPSQGSDALGHGTIIAGIIGGRANTGLRDNDGGQYYYGTGIAPGILLGSTKIREDGDGPASGTISDWAKLAVTARCVTGDLCTGSPYVTCPATAQNHSQNSYDSTGSLAGVYNTTAQEYDRAVRDADLTANGNQQLTLVVSAGNYRTYSNDTTKMVLPPGTAKNVITVGATESRRTTPATCQGLFGGENPVLRNQADGYDAIAYLSRREVNDGRVKPDLVVPSTMVYGPESSQAREKYCAQTGTAGAPNQYQGGSGTSFSAPAVAGAVGLLRFKHGPKSPAMYKAMLIGESRSLTGAIDRLETYLAGTTKTVPAWPYGSQGWGSLKLDRLIDTNYTAKWLYDQQTILQQGQEFVRTVVVSNPNEPVRIVVAYTDAEGAAQSNVHVKNVLSIEARWANGSYVPGNRFSGGYSTSDCGRPVCGPGARSNVQVININPSTFIDPANRTFSFKVLASNLIAVGVPPSAANNQDFAIFMMNVSSVY